jgi:hypothetical protein
VFPGLDLTVFVDWFIAPGLRDLPVLALAPPLVEPLILIFIPDFVTEVFGAAFLFPAAFGFKYPDVLLVAPVVFFAGLGRAPLIVAFFFIVISLDEC